MMPIIPNCRALVLWSQVASIVNKDIRVLDRYHLTPEESAIFRRMSEDGNCPGCKQPPKLWLVDLSAIEGDNAVMCECQLMRIDGYDHGIMDVADEKECVS
jgi:hypothetical protein